MNFNEREFEYSKIADKELPVEITPKYEASKRQAEKILKRYTDLSESDFWILMRESKDHSKMQYLGLIISHNACIKINEKASAADKFDPMSVTLDTRGYGSSLVYTYRNPTQFIYEIGEANRRNCKNGYPYATALKRVFDRVVLRIAKLSYEGLYSESESTESDTVDEEQTEAVPNNPHLPDEPEKFVFAPVTDAFANGGAAK